MAEGHRCDVKCGLGYLQQDCLTWEAELEGFRASHRNYRESPDIGFMLLSLWRCPRGPSVPPMGLIRSARVGGRVLDQT